jgi:hypothetical protein
MSRCIHAGNPKWTAIQLGLDYSTVCAWGQRHPVAPPGSDRPRLNGPAKQLAILMDSALEYVDEAKGRDAVEAQREDALAPLYWLNDVFGINEAAGVSSCEVEASALVLKSAGGLVERVLEFGVDGLDAAEREILDAECRALESRVRELRSLIARPLRSIRSVGGKR